MESNNLKSRNEAIVLFKRVIEIDPDNVMALFNLGLLFADENLHKQSEEMFLRTVSANPLHKSALFNLGLFALNSQNYDMCVEYLVRLVANYPEHIRGHFNLADCFMHNSDRKNAKIHYKSALKLDPKLYSGFTKLGCRAGS